MTKDKIMIGEITGTFGIRGELKVYSESDFVDYRFRKGAEVIFSNNKKHIITSSRVHKGNVLITIDNLNNINQVIDNVGMKIYTEDNDIPPLNENEYYIDQLVDLVVYNTFNEKLGIVTDVIEIPSGYILEVINDENQRFLIPFVDAFVKEITNEKIVIEEIEGIRWLSLIY